MYYKNLIVNVNVRNELLLDFLENNSKYDNEMMISKIT